MNSHSAEDPTVTVAILAYYKKYLEECIASVLAQTYQNIKIIVCDDNSPNDLISALKKFNDDRLVYRRNEENLREYGNAVNAVKLCDTPYLSIFHGDDIMHPWMIETQIDVFRSNDDIGAVFTSEKGSLDGKKTPPRGRCYRKNELIEEMAKRRMNFVISPSIMLKRSVYQKYIELTDVDMLDMHWWMALNESGVNMYGLDSEVMYYRQHQESQTNRLTIDIWTASLCYIYKWAVQKNFNDNVMRFLKSYIVQIVLGMYIRGNDQSRIEDIDEIVKSLEAELGYTISRDLISESLAIGWIGREITSSDPDVDEIRSRSRQLASLGYKIPLIRKIKWFLKYHIWA